MTMSDAIFSGFIVLAQMPAVFVAYRRAPGNREPLFWAVCALATAGPVLWVITAWIIDGWQTNLSITLMAIVATTLVLFLLTASASVHAAKLAPLVFPYLFLLIVLAIIWQAVPGQPLRTPGLALDLGFHIIVSLITFALLTLAAIAALGTFIKERALKRKRAGGISALMPSVADGERLVLRLLLAGEGVLGLDLVTGVATQLHMTGQWLVLEHKTILSLASFVVIGGMLVAHYAAGIRGKLATRLVLLGFGLLFLAYPGVKFVTDVVLD